MEKNEIIALLTQGLSMEDLPMMSSLNELKDMVSNSNLDNQTKNELMKRIGRLVNDTSKHSWAFNDMIRVVNEG
jgi:uncharacterized membrane protein YukC